MLKKSYVTCYGIYERSIPLIAHQAVSTVEPPIMT